MPGGLFFGTKMLPKWRLNPENVTPGPHRWPRGGRDGIFVDFWTIFGITLGTRGTYFSALLRSAFFTLFTQVPGTAFGRCSVDFWCHFEVFSRFVWAGVESVIFDDTTAYNHYFEGPGGRNLASFLHCFSRGLPGAAFLRLFDVFGCPGVSLWSSRALLGAPCF